MVFSIIYNDIQIHALNKINQHWQNEIKCIKLYMKSITKHTFNRSFTGSSSSPPETLLANDESDSSLPSAVLSGRLFVFCLRNLV